MTQDSLFDLPLSPLPVRSTDPETSKAAAKQLDVRERQAEVLVAMRLLVTSCTPTDIQRVLRERGMHRERNEVASRLAELGNPDKWADGMARVRKVGVKDGPRGRKVATWALTDAGQRKAREVA